MGRTNIRLLPVRHSSVRGTTEGVRESDLTTARTRISARLTFRQTYKWRSAWHLAWLGVGAMILVGCGLPWPGATFEPGVEHVTAGSVHFVADPPVATISIVVRIRAQDGSPSGRAFTLGAGAVIEDTPTTVPGPQGFIVNDRVCDGDYRVEAGQTTEVTIRLAGDRCGITVTGIHPEATIPVTEGS